MDYETIKYLSRKAARESARERREPRVFTAEQIAARDVRIPNLGDRCPRNWVRVSLEAEADDHGVYMGDNRGKGAYFVDKSGCGAPGEPAMTLDEFFTRMKPGLGYAMVEEGQFQVKVGVFAVRTAGRARAARKEAA